MNPNNLKVGDVVVCSTMEGFRGEVVSILNFVDSYGDPDYSIIRMRAQCEYTNHEGALREEGYEWNKKTTSDGWSYYDKLRRTSKPTLFFEKPE